MGIARAGQRESAQRYLTRAAHVELAPVEKDVFVAELAGAEIGFERDTGRRVIALTLTQSGQVLRGERQPR